VEVKKEVENNTGKRNIARKEEVYYYNMTIGQNERNKEGKGRKVKINL